MLPDLWRARKRQISILAVTLALALWVAVFVRQQLVGRVQRHIDAGIEYIRTGQPHDAEREWQEAAKLAPNNAGVWELLSTLYINTEQWSKGTAALQQLLRVAPNRHSIYSRMAACALRSGSELDAKRLAQEELKRNPSDEASLAILAFLSEMQNDSDLQIGYLKRLLACDPNSPATLHDLSQAYYEAGKFGDVLPVVERLIAVKPNDGYAYAMRGAARFETDASPAASAQAEADFLKALQINPLSPFARYTLGRLYLRNGQFQKAVFQLELARKLYPRKLDVFFDLATAYTRTGQSAKATEARHRFEMLRQEATLVSVLQKRCVLNTNDFDAHLQLGQLMVLNGDDRQAAYYLQHALALNPNSDAARTAYQQLTAHLKGEALTSPH